MIKKADIVLFFAILIIGLAISYFSLTGNQEGDNVVITVDGQMYATYPLDEDREIEVAQNGHINNITIKEVCVNTRPISQTKDSIVCLPNKVIVEITAENGRSDFDVITG